ncbi:MAG TPA: membrane protein insertase YidC [Rhizomicrobium sp.]|nr:membrane protein insertase YidC [Rhizomicrobium sp.]
MGENRNLIIAIALSMVVIFGWQYFIARPQMNAEKAQQAHLAQQEKTQGQLGAPQANANSLTHLSRDAALKRGGQRVSIDTPTVDGSLLLKGARFDDLRLKKYRETVNPKSPEIVLPAPQSTDYPYYAVFGWVSASKAIRVPDDNAQWKQIAGTTLSPGHPVTLAWDNGSGLVFTRQIAVDDQYMFTVSDSVTNKTSASVTLYPYAYVARAGVPKVTHYWVLHEGFVGVADGTLKDAKYTDFKDNTPPTTFHSTGGWVGITDKYWMAAVVPPQNATLDGSYAASVSNGVTDYQADYRLDGRKLGPNGTLAVTHRLFAGAKVVQTLQNYQNKLGIQHFDLAIDWGWFWFFTRPMFWLLDHLYNLVGNFGVAILLLTVVIKLIFFPLANTSYKSMSRMKKLQPEVERLRTRFAEDRLRQQQEMMELYKREKVNPVSGCLPVLIQVPVFFSLYKVLFVTIEMRHAPFFGWIHDLSAPDPTSIINVFGLLPYGVPSFIPAVLSIGIWPILMGATQWLQTQMNPAPADPVQARMFSLMPIMFIFMLATFPAGLVIYWTWNNLLSVAQQYLMMRQQGVKLDLLQNFRSSDVKAGQ